MYGLSIIIKKTTILLEEEHPRRGYFQLAFLWILKEGVILDRGRTSEGYLPHARLFS
jgi:hypothetical protein